MKARILIIDDEELLLLSWEYTLRSAGYDVVTASEGEKAVEIARQQKPDIAITDLIISDMSGIEVCRKIKESSPETHVVLISGHPEELRASQRDFVSAGGRDEVLVKPLSKAEIIEAVEKVLNP
jgi:two-component system alkaline phosphatase synthesis response regulator PhoP